MIVYQTDYDGRFVGEIQLNKGDICPKTKKYLIPGGCVTVEPPEIPDGKELFWQDGGWMLVDISLESELVSEEVTTEMLSQIEEV